MASYNQYSGYGGNPYEQGSNPYAEQSGNPYGGQSGSNPYGGQSGGYGSSNPYGGDGYGQSGGYGGQQQQQPQGQGLSAPAPAIQHQASTYSQRTQDSHYSHEGAAANAPPLPGPIHPGQEQQVEYVQPASVISNQDFLSRVEAVKADIRTLTTQVGNIASMHQRTLSSPDNSSSSAQLESLITDTQVLNTSVRDQIKFLETDAARSRDNQVKNTQVGQLKTSFQKQLQEYRQEEASYGRRYREQIARQYRIVNPEASESEVQEAANADWGNEGVFQTALKSNRSATASTVLGAVRARHNDIQKIESTMIELQKLMEDLATAVVLQEAPVQAMEQNTTKVKDDTEAGNVQLDKGIKSARNARKLKWWCLFIVVLILIIIGAVLGWYFGAGPGSSSGGGGGGGGTA